MESAEHVIDDKIAALRVELRRLERVVVAFSGGADSAFLAAVAHQVLGDDAHAVTAVSPSLAGDEEADCRALADEWGLRWTPVVTHEMERAAYRINDTDRCYHCKAELMDVVAPDRRGRVAPPSCWGSTSTTSATIDPARRAADQRGATFPLVDCRIHQGRCPRRVAAVSACARGTSRQRHAWPVAFRTAPRSPWHCSARSTGPRRHCDASDSPSCGCATTATRRGSRCRSSDLTDVIARRARRRRCHQGCRLPLRHARPRGLPIRQPQPQLDRAHRSARPRVAS